VRAPAPAALRNGELVIQVEEVLLDRGVGDDERIGDLSHGGGLGEDVLFERRTA
jgi:hypothetical protein